MEISIPVTKSIFAHAFQKEKPYCFSDEGLELVYDHIVQLPSLDSKSSYTFGEIQSYYKENTLAAFFRIHKEAVLDNFEYSEEFSIVDQIRELEPYDRDGIDLIVEKDIEQAKKIIHTFLESNECFVGFASAGTEPTQVSVVYESFL